jgi:hypothetical protein
MAKQLANHWQRAPLAGRDAREAVPKVMEANIGNSRHIPNARPVRFQVHHVFRRMETNDDIGTVLHARRALQHVDSSLVEMDDLWSRLGVWQPELAPLEVDVLPLECQDFPDTRAGKEQKADGRDRD